MSKTLDMCYNKCSIYKQEIYNKCYNQIYTLYLRCSSYLDWGLGITGYNCNFFTFEGYVEVTKNIYVLVKQTYANNYITIMYCEG